MEITLNARSGFYLEIKTDNVHITEDIEERIYSKTSEGKIDFTKLPKRDIKTDEINNIDRLLQDMIYYREAEYDSSDLIKLLFEKLPANVACVLSNELYKQYKDED